jgi:antitoxin (DNA-binding transcriptional repressor) of toxin-antitoxin stability system
MMKTISLFLLIDRISPVLLEVESGQSMRVTLAGIPIADLVPIPKSRRMFVDRADVEDSSRAPHWIETLRRT